jgi:hypothetical protein
MKKLLLLLFLAVIFALRAGAQETRPAGQYQVPAVYHFDYKVVYIVDTEEKKADQSMSYYFPSDGEYMSMETPGMTNEKEKDMEFMIMTKDGLMITFGEEHNHNSSGNVRKVLKIIDIHSMMKGITESSAGMSKTVPKKDNSETGKKNPYELDNFVKTGRTKAVFGYTAEEYSKQLSFEDNGKTHSGTLSVWYAKVDFDPEMMFSMGMGITGGGSLQSRNQPYSNSLFGLGLTQKNYLMTEMDFAENGGPYRTGMKVTGIEKTNFNKSTEGYYVENYAGLSMKEIMEKEMGNK